ncbi:MAG: MBL fold metallo-hydrolase [Roseivirga sp.]|jgi:glyoxylase-like metal-dependent hydrolase (beta-lactamase superfamily II)/rhodanese-related sulfurtransferase|uniref:MBL fold metallo-hydrolase n=1 Tax=Roseivirga sp. TaxID=1964215 RepID=UPI001B01E0CF|nr:MBL fold metallo-hydrolase [Roseivirga sp.]MBO6496356.1 MBL fold metallo-hydrolase [Roseivirga sp.]
MKIEQIYTQCLAEAAYYIESNGEAAIVDPLREVEPYIEMAKQNGATIKYVLETHFHADFVSGHLDLAKKTGATIVYGPTAQPNFKAHVATDGEALQLGNVKIKVLHTPGHTMESSTFLLIDEAGKNHSIFTGDTLFLGDVGRPDLAVKTDLSREDLAAHLFDSLRNKIMPLADDVIVYPGHGQGSACGKNMSSETVDTLGNQKKFNYALRADMTKEEFVQEVTSDLVAPPQYFPKNAVMNKMGYESIDQILEQGVIGLDVKEFKQVVRKNKALILDTRPKEQFAEGFIPNSIFIGIDDTFAPWVGALITDLNTPIVFLAEEGKEEEVVVRLSRVGYDNALGFLKGGIKAWRNAGEEVQRVEQVSAEEFVSIFENGANLLDVRKESEFESQHIKGATNFPLDFINTNLKNLDIQSKWYIHCAGGYRSMIATSILLSSGYYNAVNIKGGFKALKETALPMTEFQEQITML